MDTHFRLRAPTLLLVSIIIMVAIGFAQNVSDHTTTRDAISDTHADADPARPWEVAQPDSNHTTATDSPPTHFRLNDHPDNLTDGYLRGPSDAKLTVVFFDDLQCPFSAAAYKTLFDVLKDYEDQVKVRLWPTFNSRLHPWALHAVINAECLGSQRPPAFWDFVDRVHTGLDSLTLTRQPFQELDEIALDIGRRQTVDLGILRECIRAQVDASAQDSYHRALATGLHAIPTLIIGTVTLEGARPAQDYRNAINSALTHVQGVHAPRTPEP